MFPVWWQVSARAFGIGDAEARFEAVRVEDAEAHAVWPVRQMRGKRIADLEGGDPTDLRTMLDVAVASGIQPDVDTDGDGRERFELDPATGLLARCLDGDGTLVEGSDCAADPRFADGYDITLLFRLERALPVSP